MSENGVNGHNVAPVMEWRVGFMNHALKYLTAETFGHKVNVSGTALKKKQIWFLEQDPTDNWVYIRSHLGFYATSDKYGKVTVEAEEKTESERFLVEYSNSGKWAFKHVMYGNYLSGVDDNVKCFSKAPVDKEWWSIQLDVHPQVCLRNVNRKRYARLNGDELECKEIIPWGPDSLITLDFVDGKYALKACDSRALNKDGLLQDNVDDNALFTMEVYSAALSFKDCEGRYLTAVGTGTMKARNTKVTKDELFTIEDSHPQCKIKSHNGKYVSIKQGVDVSANQEEIEDTEIFQLEFCKASENWAFRTCKNTCWNLQTGGTVQVKGAEPTKDGFFSIDWQEDGSVGIKGTDGKYLSNKQTGALFSLSSELGDQQKFKILIVNRPLLVLKGEHGFVGTKMGQYICNKAKHDMLSLEITSRDTYILKGPDGKFFGIGDDACVCPEDSPTEFKFEFCGQSVLAIRAPNGCYLKGEQNGLFKAVSNEITSACLWEF